METTKPIPQPAFAPAPAQPLATQPLPAAALAPPWVDDHDEAAAAPACRKAVPAGASQVQAVHWAVVLLTLFTAASVLFGSHGVEVTHSRELLPLMIVAD